MLCGALAPQNAPQPELACETGAPEPSTINTVIEVPPITLQGAATGTCVLYMQLVDARGVRSAVATATFTVGVRL